MRLSPKDISILSILDEDAGFMTKHIAQKLDPKYYEFNGRICAGAFRSWLMRLKREGLVRFMDNEKPTVWARTPEGTRIYQEVVSK